MAKIISKIIILIVTMLFLTSCNDEFSLQKYYVDSEQNDDIIMVDIPASMIVVEDNIPTEAKEALESINKLNLLAFRLKEDNKAAFNEEKAKVKKILSNKSYKELLRVNDKSVKITVKYLGDDDVMDEVIVYAADSKKGFALGRLLGKDMRPEQMMVLMENVKDLDGNSETLQSIENFFN